MTYRAFIDSTGVLHRVSTTPVRSESLQSEEMSDPDRLARSIRAVSDRVSYLETSSDPGYVEFEVIYSNLVFGGITVELEHGYDQTVRWQIVDFVGTAEPKAWRVASTVVGSITLAFNQLGTYIIRISPSGVTE